MKMKKILALALAAVLLMAVTVAGTVAYLTATSGPVENTFTPSEVGVKIEETTGNTYQFVPAVDIKKDPKVTATADVDCYVFVKITETDWPTTLIPYTVADGWNLLVTSDNVKVYYRACTASETNQLNQSWSVIANDTIEVKDELTVDQMKTIKSTVKLTFDAYIIQQAGFSSPEAAWNEVGKTPAATVPTTPAE